MESRAGRRLTGISIQRQLAVLTGFGGLLQIEIQIISDK